MGVNYTLNHLRENPQWSGIAEVYTKLLRVQETLPITSSLTVDGSATTVPLRDDLEMTRIVLQISVGYT